MNVTMDEGPLQILDVADCLLRERPESAAYRCRAVSSAYYAVFHALAEACAGTLLPDVPVRENIYIRTYRALDHGPLRQAFGQLPLRVNDQLRPIGDAVIELQSARHAADYRPLRPDAISENGARILVEVARQTIDGISALVLADRRLLATCLLFKTR
jgi:hypothetical protein